MDDLGNGILISFQFRFGPFFNDCHYHYHRNILIMIMDVGILTMFFFRIYQYLPLYGGFLSHVGKPFAKV